MTVAKGKKIGPTINSTSPPPPPRHVARHNLAGLLRRYRAAGPEEAGMVQAALTLVEGEARCLDAGFTAPGHITGSAWVLDAETHGSALLTHHRKLGRWFQLGGHLEPGETALEGALREAREESGLEDVRPLSEEIFDVDVHPIPACGPVPAHHHYDIRFLFEASAAAPLVCSSESRSLAWVRLEDAHRYNSSESILRMVRKC